MINQVVIIISPDSWNALPVSKHHYAMELAKNNTVYFIDKEVSKANILDKNVHIIRNYTRVKGLNRMPVWLAKQMMKVEVNSILKMTGKPDIVWSFDTSRLYFLSLFGATTNIAHIVDFTEHFKFNELIQEAHVCLASSDSILVKMGAINPRVFKINHGYYAENLTTPSPLSSSQKIATGIYIGNLAIKYLDWHALYTIINHRKDIEFVFIGNLTEKVVAEQQVYFDRIRGLENVTFKGRMNPDDVQRALLEADFCLMTYREKEFPNQLQNPHKIMQYLGSGKPVFASYTHEYRLSDLLFMYRDSNAVEKVFDEFLANSRGDFSQMAREKRINFALDNTYSKQIERIESILITIKK
jgi:glycosyltransferase involved in cell wall biosynthesis